MLIRRPSAIVFLAFTDPNEITKFWLAASSGALAVGKKIRWDFMVKGASAELHVKAFEKNRRILGEWDDGTTVEWNFTELDEERTVVSITNSGFGGNAEEAMAAALDATQGFTIVLCDLKTLLETGTSANLVRDKAALIEMEK